MPVHWVRPCSIDERMSESNAEQCEQRDPTNPRERHEGREETTWRILMAPAQVTPKSLRAFTISAVRVRFPQKVEISHSRDGGTNEPHHPKHGKRDAFYTKGVND